VAEKLRYIKNPPRLGILLFEFDEFLNH